MNMVLPYLVSQLLGGVLGAAMAKVNLSHIGAIKSNAPSWSVLSEVCLTQCQQAMTSAEKFARTNGAAFAVLHSNDPVGGALFGEVAMTCLITLVLLLGAVNTKTRSPMVPFLVGCTVIFNILAG